MHPQTIYTKTTKGVLEVKTKTIRLPRALGLLFLAVDGKSKVADLATKSGVAEAGIPAALEKLVADGYIRILVEAPAAGGTAGAEDLDLDFTSPAKVALLNTEAEQRAKAEAEAKARAETAARAAAEAKARQEVE